MRHATTLVLLVFAHDAAAQRADAPVVHAGDEWRFVAYYSVRSATPNRRWIVTSVSGAGIEATENGEPLRLTPELNVLESPRSTSSHPKALSFPLEVGKQWRYRTDWHFKPKSSSGYTIVEVTVAGYERVEVPAGEFEAFRLVARGALHGTSPIGSRYDGQTTSTYWYAPAARAIVKSIDHNPYLGTATVELVEARPAR